MSALAGHIMHLFENFDLTLQDICNVFTGIGTSITCYEKVDGMNLYITQSNGRLLVARAMSDIPNGLSEKSLISRFAHAPKAAEAFGDAFFAIQDAIDKMSNKLRLEIFGDREYWYSVEVVTTKNPNVIRYTENCIVIHAIGSGKFDVNGHFQESVPFSVFNQFVNWATKNSISNWKFYGPIAPKLKPLSSERVDAYRKMILAHGRPDTTIGDVVRKHINHVVLEKFPDISLTGREDIVNRLMKSSGYKNVTQLTAGRHSFYVSKLKDLVSQEKSILRDAVESIRKIIYDFSCDFLSGAESAISMLPVEASRMRLELYETTQRIEASNDVLAKAIVVENMQKIKSYDEIVPMEGIVFSYAGIVYKLTGTFGPMNAILGFQRYKRGNKG